MHIASVPVPSHSRLRRIVIGLFVLVLGFAFMGMTYENIFEARDRRFNPTEGQLVDVGGKNMHIDCQGQGSPTVLLESGLGQFIAFKVCSNVNFSL